MTAPRVSIICQNHGEDRIIPRMARYLRDRLGWTLGAAPDPHADVVYLSAYFEAQKLRSWPVCPTAVYFTHREEEPSGNAKARLYDQVAERANLRVSMCRLYAEPLSIHGPTIQPPLPIEQDRFIIAPRKHGQRPVVGFAGYTYANHRKGEDLVRGIIESKPGLRCEWQASGRGWPVPTRRYTWAEMPAFYQSLDVLICPSRVEGGPMPVLEALACGVPVIVPRGVGILDEIPDAPGIYHYGRGELAGLIEALGQAIDPPVPVEREALRQAVDGHTVAGFVEGIRAGIEELLNPTAISVAVLSLPAAEDDAEMTARLQAITIQDPIERGTGSTRGIYCVAFGEPARRCAVRMIQSVRQYMPDVPIALAGARPLGIEDVFVEQPDSDVGGRRAKIKTYELAPAEWQTILYLDADTEVVAPIYQYFKWIEDGWDFVICRDVPPSHILRQVEAKVSKAEAAETFRIVGTWHALQYNGGVWTFARKQRVAEFFAAWRTEWERYAQRDQASLVRALHLRPLKMLLLGNHWNTFPKFQPKQETAGLLHWPGDARRWIGPLPGRIDSPAAWAIVERCKGRFK